MRRIIEGAHLVPLGAANAVLLEGGEDGLVLVDAGFPGKAPRILDAVRRLGRTPRDLRHLVLTHAHPDHIGSAAAIVRETGATTWMHAEDAPIAESGGPFRPMRPAPGLLQRALFRMVWRDGQRVDPVRIDRRVAEGETLPIAGGLAVLHVPGHCAGQIALLWQGERLLIAADVGINVLRPDDPIGFEDQAEGRRSQRRIAGLRFGAAAFGHGGPIRARASDRLRRAWAGR